MHNSMYQEVLHVPLVIQVPGDALEAHRVADVVRTVDIFPTTLELLDVPEESQGRSLVPLMKGDSEPHPRPVWSHWPAPGNQAFRWNDWKFIQTVFRARQREPDRFELYDLATDPRETKNLYRDRPEVFAKLSKARAQLAAPSTTFRERVGAGRSVTLAPSERAELEALGYLGGGN